MESPAEEEESFTPLATFDVESPTTLDMERSATFNTKSPTTPPRRKQTAELESSTPLAKGTASHQSHHEQNTQAEFAPYLQQDLTLKDELELEDFLSQVFTGIDQDLVAVKEVESNKEVKRLLNTFADQLDSPIETHRYQPFTELANAAMTALRGTAGTHEIFVFCRNDPTYVAGSHAERKPDVVGVWEKALVDVNGRLSVNNLCDKGPSEAPFAWHELLMFIEFKVKETKTAQSKPPSSHNTLACSRTTVSKLKLQAPVRTITTRSMDKAPSPLHVGGVITSQPIKAINPAVTTAAPNDPSPPPVPDFGNDVLKSRTSAQASTPKSTTDLFTQCASYALEMMSHGGIRHHALGASIVGSNITLQYYGHSVILYSKPFNIIDDFAQFLSVLRLLMSLGHQGWGFADPVPTSSSHTPPWIFDKRKPHLSLYQGLHYQLGGQTFVLGDILHQQHGIIGRGTCVIGAESNQGVEAVVKFSWRESERTQENVFIEHALRHAPPREDVNSIARHLPSILGHKTDDRWMTTLGSKCEPRHLQIMAFAKLTPITHITNVTELAEAYRGIFKCYKWLYNEARILHRDISLNNLMYYRDCDNDKIYGVLNDFDLSHQMTGEHPHPRPASTKQRTGTLPFMAIDFLHDTPMIHGYRHDMESFMWVILFHIGQYRDGKSVGLSGPYHKWLLDNRRALLIHKVEIRDMVHDAQAQAAFRPLLRWINKMIAMFDKAGRAIRDHKREPEGKFDVESSGGCITFDGFEAILTM